MEVTKEFFGKTKDGIPVFRFIMKNSKGMEAAVLEYGCTLQELWVPDKEGNKVNSLEIKSQKVQSDNEEGISDWELLDVKNTPFDFSKEKRIGENIGEETPQLKYGHGYDHNYYLGGDKELRKVTTLFSDRTGRMMMS